VNDVATSFIDVLALTVVGILFTWSPGKHGALPMRVPEVAGAMAPIRATPPLPVVVRPDGVLTLGGAPATLDDVVAAVEKAPRALHVCADADVAWGVVAARISDLQARWTWVQAGVRAGHTPKGGR